MGRQFNEYGCFESIMSIPTTFRLFLVLTSEQISRRLPLFTLLRYCDNVSISQSQMWQIISNCNMETPRKPQNKHQCSVPHYLSNIRNIHKGRSFSFDDRVGKKPVNTSIDRAGGQYWSIGVKARQDYVNWFLRGSFQWGYLI